MTERKFKCTINYDGTSKKEPAYCVVAPLRIMVMKNRKPEDYKKIMELQDHLEERINTPLYGVLKANLVTFIKTILCLEEFDENDLLKLAAILDTNAFDVRIPSKDVKVRALYTNAAMMAHNCVPNTRHVFDDNMQILFIATVDIPKGTTISASYTQPLYSTMRRRELLRQFKCFDCSCERCADPSEFGTYVGAIVCSKCSIGKVRF